MTELPGRSSGSELLIETIGGRIKTPLVRNAFRKVDRVWFVPKGWEDLAYRNAVIELSDEATISQPAIVAEMTELLGLTGKEKVLEVGTGSGYQAAILSRCARQVHTVEYDPELSEIASLRLTRLGYGNVTVHTGDGAKGLPQQAPFDAIIVTASVREIPEPLEDQLVEGGRIVAPLGKDPWDLLLTVSIKYQGMLLTRGETRVRFVPLMSEVRGGWTKELLDASKVAKQTYIEWLLENGLSDREREILFVLVSRAIGVPPSEITIEDLVEHLPVPQSVFDSVGEKPGEGITLQE